MWNSENDLEAHTYAISILETGQAWLIDTLYTVKKPHRSSHTPNVHRSLLLLFSLLPCLKYDLRVTLRADLFSLLADPSIATVSVFQTKYGSKQLQSRKLKAGEEEVPRDPL